MNEQMKEMLDVVRNTKEQSNKRVIDDIIEKLRSFVRLNTSLNRIQAISGVVDENFVDNCGTRKTLIRDLGTQMASVNGAIRELEAMDVVPHALMIEYKNELNFHIDSILMTNHVTQREVGKSIATVQEIMSEMDPILEQMLAIEAAWSAKVIKGLAEGDAE